MVVSKDIGQLSAKYPPSIQQWNALINTAADDYGIPSDLIAAVMLQESGGQSSVISSSGAVGLLQVMPRDGKAASFVCNDKPCFSNRPSITELEDPQFNIHYGTYLLRSLIDHHPSLREALRAYGPMDVGFEYADLVLSIYNQYH